MPSLAASRFCRCVVAFRSGWGVRCFNLNSTSGCPPRAGFQPVCASASLIAVLWLALTGPARAETLPEALVRTYQNNPQLNAERARQRGTDEGVSQALAGYRPQLLLTLTGGLQQVRVLFFDNTIQTQTLRNTGQGVLLDAVTAYTNVLANQSLVEAQRINVTALRETLATTKTRLEGGDVTPTDVAQAEARLSRGLADLNAAEVGLAISQALYAQVIGVPPGRLVPAESIDRLLPRTREEATAISRKEHPAILAAMYDIDVAQFGTKIAESSLLPTLSVQGNLQRQWENDPTLSAKGNDIGSLLGTASVPIYDGGLAASQIRQAKEIAMQARIVLELIRNQTQTAVLSAWVTFEGAKVALAAAEAEVRAASVALAGVQKEAQAGQRTTLDVLNSQQDLTAARARLIGAQRDRVIAAYALLGAVGRLDVKTLALNTPDYAPEVHYHQVRDAWHGLRTPAGQ